MVVANNKNIKLLCWTSDLFVKCLRSTMHNITCPHSLEETWFQIDYVNSWIEEPNYINRWDQIDSIARQYSVRRMKT